MTSAPQIGLLVPPDWFTRPQPERQARIDAAAQAGLDHLVVGDHVSFFVGAGFDGLTQATALLAQHPTLRVHVAVYLLALRHPVPLARTLATIAELAPGRLALGVGVGGEDRHEIEICGVDPATRGSRTDEALAIVRGLMTGEPVTFHGRHFDLDDALILPAPTPPIPLLVGGRSDAALRRAARHGDGWLGIWVSARRFAQAASTVAELADAAGREVADWQHELNVWCAFGPDRERARAHIAPRWRGSTPPPSSGSSGTHPTAGPRTWPSSSRPTSTRAAGRSTSSPPTRTPTRRSPASPRSVAFCAAAVWPAPPDGRMVV